MPNAIKLLFCLVALSSITTPVRSANTLQLSAEDRYTLWGIGRAGVMCYMAPCPWQGIFPISPETGERGFPVARHGQPQVISADPAITARVADAYSENHCLMVEARPVEDGLDIARIIGEC